MTDLDDGWLRPGEWIGILGGGQLGRMMAQAAHRLGYHVAVLDPEPDSPAGQVADVQVVGEFVPDRAQALAERCAVVTYEFENVDLAAARAAAERTPVLPDPRVLELSRNRLREKDAVVAAGLATVPYRAVATAAEAEAAVRALGAPVLFKTAEGGYDGKGQRRVERVEEAAAAFAALRGGPWQPLIAERMVAIAKEISVVGARGRDGSWACFPPAENRHHLGILDWSMVPAGVPAAVATAAVAATHRLLEAWDVVGLLTVEFFWTAEGELVINETAPRPHNSGHYTIEACRTSQFEQVVRAVCGLPLGNPGLIESAAMANLLGELWIAGGGQINVPAALALPVSLHLYGKREPRRGRKMGHITALAESGERALAQVLEARRRFAGPAVGELARP